MSRIESHPILTVPTETREVSFSFDGRSLRGREGEMISSALFANGVREFSRHRVAGASQGIFCANGQCSQCTVIVDGFPLKACVTPLREGMAIRTLEGLPSLPEDDAPLGHVQTRTRSCDVLVIGGGPSGLTAALELARAGLDVLLVDDKDRLGGKLVLQTHKFFGSIADCYAGTRGVDIAKLLSTQVLGEPRVEVLLDTSVVALYRDGRAGLFVANRGYEVVAFRGIVLTAGAREKSLLFPGNDLPGVYGAGAFQTLVNRDLVRPADRVFIAGSGNVGLIAAYHALQAGIAVVGICDILRKPSGYKVHADKIRRMGVPIHLGCTILSAEANPGTGRLARVTLAEVDEHWAPLLDTARSYAVDTLLMAVGLSPVDEFHALATRYGYEVVKAGDADEIAEASSAMFGGRLAGIELARRLGRRVDVDPTWAKKAEILRSRPGRIHEPRRVTLGEAFAPILHCTEEIPCNPCTSVCPSGAIQLRGDLGNLLDPPVFDGKCTACRMCVAVCPGLAIVLARAIDETWAEMILPHEFLPTFKVGDRIPLCDVEGAYVEDGEVLGLTQNRKYRTWLARVRVHREEAPRIAGIRVQDPAVTAPLPVASLRHVPEDAIVCRCERVTLGELVAHIREHRVTDVNQLKQIRVGMGACGSRTCSTLLPRAFALAGVPWEKIAPGTKRPLGVEVPMGVLVNEERQDD
jgi:thioredoxin reductase/Fe-S-cluster-containing hydrogenase component 2